MTFAESIEQGSLYSGCVFSSKHGWMISKDGQRFPGPLRAAVMMASCHLQLTGRIGIRVDHGVRRVEATPGTEASIIMWWLAGRREDCSWIQVPGAQRASTAYLFGDIWPNTPFLQFLVVSEDEVRQARRQTPGVAH
eukprot:9466970-Pyramimonas_sp.AAC.1